MTPSSIPQGQTNVGEVIVQVNAVKMPDNYYGEKCGEPQETTPPAAEPVRSSDVES